MTPHVNERIDAAVEKLEPKPEPFVVEAVVKFNKGEALVLNRDPKFLYEGDGQALIARDGPFVAVYRYERPCGRFKAFAGREFDIPLKNGKLVHATGQWWDASLKGLVKATYNTKARLLNCYVYYGCSADPDELRELRETYTGDVYPYYAYKDVIRAPDLRLRAFRAERKFERAKAHILSNLREIVAENKRLKAEAQS